MFAALFSVICWALSIIQLSGILSKHPYIDVILEATCIQQIEGGYQDIMNTLPFEILASIASEIESANDLANFRLVCPTWAAASRSHQARQIAVLNTSEHLQELVDFLMLNPEFARHTTSIHINHATWPICTREAWETHPLLFCGNNAMNYPCNQSKANCDRAFLDYRTFIMNEAHRNLEIDQTVMRHILKLLPRLERITIGHVRWRMNRAANTKYHKLLKRIYMSAQYKDSIGPCVRLALPVLVDFPRIRELNLKGSLDPTDLLPYDSVQAKNIEILRMDSLLMFAASPQPSIDFSRRFPNIRSLLLKLGTSGPQTNTILHNVHWPQLSEMDCGNIHATDIHLRHFIERHFKLRRLKIQDITLIAGTWETFFEHVKGQCVALELQGDGFIHCLSDSLFLDLRRDEEQRRLLVRYLETRNFPWPFDSST